MVTLRDKFYGCILGAHIGSAMGAPVEGWTYQKCESTYGCLDKLVPYEHYENGWVRAAGTTEDGIDRQKLMITAIIEKGDRVNAEDVRKIWCRDIRADAPGGISEPFEGELLAMAKTRIPAKDLGRYCDYAGLNSMARACHPLGLINAGDIQGAIDDVMEVGQLYQTTNSRGLKWACVTSVAIASATKSGSTVDSVLQDIFAHLDERAYVPGRDDGWYADYAGVNIVDEIQMALDLTKDCRDYKSMRQAFDPIYNGVGMPYCMSYANEIVCKALAVFRLANGDVKKAIITAVNMGRDTDCLAAVAAGLTGALGGSASVPKEWIEQVDYATSIHRFTNNKRTMKECSDGLYYAFKKRLSRMREYADKMSID